jgi:hypothetical protein
MRKRKRPELAPPDFPAAVPPVAELPPDATPPPSATGPAIGEEDYTNWDADAVVWYREALNIGSVFGLGYLLDFFSPADDPHAWRCYRRALTLSEEGYVLTYGPPELWDSDGGGASPSKSGYAALSAECQRLGAIICPPPSTGPTKRQATAARKRRKKQLAEDEAHGNGAA